MGFTEYCIKYKAKICIDYEPSSNRIVYKIWYPNGYGQIIEQPVREFTDSTIDVESKIIEQLEDNYILNH